MRGIVPFRGFTPTRLTFPALREDMNQLFEGLFDGGQDPKAGLAAFQPSIDVHEDDAALVVKADVPGIDPSEIGVSVSDGVLTIQGERTTEEEKQEGQRHVVERRFGSFRRSFTLPNNVDVESIEATQDHGVLTIRLPKTVESKSKKIEIRAAK